MTRRSVEDPVAAIPASTSASPQSSAGTALGLFWLTCSTACLAYVCLRPGNAFWIGALSMTALIVNDGLGLLELLPDAGHLKVATPIDLAHCPGVTAVISAYLPNEVAVIHDTVDHFLNKIDYGGKLKVIVAYNCPTSLPIESELEQLACKTTNLSVVRVPHSHRKATNINFILPLITTSIICFFDADSRPSSDAFTRAAAILGQGFDFVQGSNIVRNQCDGLLQSLVSHEMLLKYGVSYSGRYCGFQVTYFTGSNGYWLTSVAREIRCRTDAQVEDIDMSIRAMLNGSKLAYAPEITATEEAPPDLGSWWRQRVRWAEGWSQLTRWHQLSILRSQRLTFSGKLVWFWFMAWRRLVMPSAAVLVAFSLVFCLHRSDASRLIIMICAKAVLQTILTLAAFNRLRDRAGLPWQLCWRKLGYGLMFPLYDLLRTASVVRGAWALVAKPQSWNCTRRSGF